MAKAFFRNVTDQITGSNSKTTDIQIVNAINRFDEEHTKLTKFKREFDKYTQAILIFDNASHRFFDNIHSIIDPTWPQQGTFIQTCIDMRRIRNEHLQQLYKDINSNISLSFNKFEEMKIRIDEQSHIQHDYDKIRKQYQTIIKRDEQIKIDRIKSELDQLKSALNLLNSELRIELPKFHINLQNDYIKNIIDLFDIHGKYYKNFQKLCSNSNKKFQNTQTNGIKNNIIIPIVNSDYKIPCEISLVEEKLKDYKILHHARVIHDYKAENEDEIDLIKDEYISVIRFLNEVEYKHDNDWEYAEKSDGTIGLFPVNFAIRLYDNEEKQ